MLADDSFSLPSLVSVGRMGGFELVCRSSDCSDRLFAVVSSRSHSLLATRTCSKLRIPSSPHRDIIALSCVHVDVKGKGEGSFKFLNGGNSGVRLTSSQGEPEIGSQKVVE